MLCNTVEAAVVVVVVVVVPRSLVTMSVEIDQGDGDEDAADESP